MGYSNKIDEKKSLLIELHSKLEKNLKRSLETEGGIFERVEIKARSFTIVCDILEDKYNLLSHQKEILTIFDELFADIIISIYLAGCALDKPAQSLLRRVIELGVGVVYLWDLPHKFWGWKERDIDLSFNEMVSHVNSEEYRILVFKENPGHTQEALIDHKKANEIYGSLSDTIHGKISTFESVLPDRYDFNLEDWAKHLNKTEEIETILLDLWRQRFLHVANELDVQCPQLERIH